MNFGVIILNQIINKMQSYTDTDSFIVLIKTENVYEDIANDVEKRL